jgi:hypothetical protein
MSALNRLSMSLKLSVVQGLGTMDFDAAAQS